MLENDGKERRTLFDVSNACNVNEQPGIRVVTAARDVVLKRQEMLELNTKCIGEGSTAAVAVGILVKRLNAAVAVAFGKDADG